jgi:hypothetical protein
MCSKNILFSIFILRIFSSVVNAMVIDTSMEELKKIQSDNLPEYGEYLRRLKMEGTTTTTTPGSIRQKDLPIDFFSQLPSFHLCKEAPAEDDIYGRIFCFAMFLFYLEVAITLILYQLRSLQKSIKTKLAKNQESENEEIISIELLSNGHNSNQQHNGGKSSNEAGLQRMLPV